MDDKDRFKLALRGYKYGGHLEYWCMFDGDLAGIKSSHYTLFGRAWGFEIINDGDEQYVLCGNSYATLGEKVSHGEMIQMIT